MLSIPVLNTSVADIYFLKYIVLDISIREHMNINDMTHLGRTLANYFR